MQERSCYFFVYNILKKIIKESIFGTYFDLRHLQQFIEIFVLVYSSSLGLKFLSFVQFTQPFNQVCVI